MFDLYINWIFKNGKNILSVDQVHPFAKQARKNKNIEVVHALRGVREN